MALMRQIPIELASMLGSNFCLKSSPGGVPVPMPAGFENPFEFVGGLVGALDLRFTGATHFVTTTRNGPPMSDVQIRRTYSLTTGKLIDECNVDDLSDKEI